MAVRRMSIRGNRFENCSRDRFSYDIESLDYDIALKNCEDIRISNNISDRGDSHIVHLDNVELIEQA